MSAIHTRVEIAEARLLLRWAAATLNDTERTALSSFAVADREESATARQVGVTKQALFFARQTGIVKMRRRLRAAGIRGCADLLSEAS